MCDCKVLGVHIILHNFCTICFLASDHYQTKALCWSWTFVQCTTGEIHIKLFCNMLIYRDPILVLIGLSSCSLFCVDMLPCTRTCSWNLDAYTPNSIILVQFPSFISFIFLVYLYSSLMMCTSLTDEGLYCHPKAKWLSVSSFNSNPISL